MKRFNNIMQSVNTTFGAALLGNAIAQTMKGNYKESTILLFVVSGLFVVGYFTERLSK